MLHAAGGRTLWTGLASLGPSSDAPVGDEERGGPVRTRWWLLAVGALALLTGCGAGGAPVPVASAEGEEVASPSGEHVATLVAGPEQDGVGTLVVEIADGDGDVVFRSGEAYSTRHGVAVAWQSDGDVLWVLSSDVGTARVEASSGTWEQTFLTAQTRADVPPEIDALR